MEGGRLANTSRLRRLRPVFWSRGVIRPTSRPNKIRGRCGARVWKRGLEPFAAFYARVVLKFRYRTVDSPLPRTSASSLLPSSSTIAHTVFRLRVTRCCAPSRA